TTADGEVRLWDVKTRRSPWQGIMGARQVGQPSFSPDGRYIAAAVGDGVFVGEAAPPFRGLGWFRQGTEEGVGGAFVEGGREILIIGRRGDAFRPERRPIPGPRPLVPPPA